MLGKLEATITRLRNQTDPPEVTDSHLFSCDSCETIYIATEKGRV